MKLTRKILAAAALTATMLGAGGCFTGVESTPRIDASDVRREHAAEATPEQAFLADIVPQPPAKWKAGKRFRATDDRIARIFTAASANAESLSGSDLIFMSTSSARTLTGDDATDIEFRTDDGSRFFYRVAALDAQKLDTLRSLEIPFTVDIDMVAEIDAQMRGKVFYVRTPAWYNPSDGSKEDGLRHIQVRIDSVLPGDAYFPALVCFSVVDPALDRRTGSRAHALYMSVGNSRSATRNFDVLFHFDNPRKTYPEIKDDVWALIISSKVREGMSRDECRLALGAPPEVLRTPTYGGMREVWSYSDGVFLIFEDGYLTRFRL